MHVQIKLEQEALDHVQSVYIKPSHQVFDLVPQAFGECISHFYDGLGCSPVTWQSAWDIYLQLLELIQHANEMPPQIQLLGGKDEEIVLLLENYQDLPACEESSTAYYMGSVNEGLSVEPSTSLSS
jgi:hypothetical protein